EQAGQFAIERSAYLEAISHFSKGLEVLSALPEIPERLQQELTLQLALGASLSMLKGYTAPEVEHVYTRAQELCRQVGDSPELGAALVGLRRFYSNRAELKRAYEIGEQLLRLAHSVQNPAFFLQAHCALGVTLFHLGEFPSALAHLEQGFIHYDAQHRP